MLPVTTAATVRAQDAAVIDQLGVPGQVLMELAGRGAADAIAARWPPGVVVVLCGPGNNGGDGYVVARWLHLWGHEVTIWAPGPPRTDDAAAMAALCDALGVPVVVEGLGAALEAADLVVDAMLGTGQREAPRGALGEATELLSTLADDGTAVVALDLPTGLHSDTGVVLGACPRCALTVTFGRWKPGLLSGPGHHLAGPVQVIDIGLDLAAHADPVPAPWAQAWLLQASDVAGWWPRESPDSAKWHRGHVAVRGGGGAAVLAAHAALRAGAGLVSLLVPRNEWDRLHGLWPDVVLGTPDDLDPRRHDAVVIGPGLGVAAPDILALWTGFPGPVLADADALTRLASGAAPPAAAGPRVITPHSAEAGRLLGCTRAQVESDRLDAARRLAAWGTAVLKGPHTLITDDDTPWINPTGDVRLATGGTGDVLAGVIGTLLARGVEPRRAAAAGAYVHGAAGERLARNAGASALVLQLGGAIDDLLAG